MTKALLDRITVNEHSSIRAEAADCVVYVDPFHIPDAPHDADVVFITHSHFDHFSPDDVAAVWGAETLLVYPASMQKEAEGLGLPRERLVPLTAGDTVTVRGVQAEAVPAYNIGKPFHPKSKGWLGYILTLDGTRVYIAGDTDATPEAESVVCDIALLPIGGTYTANADAAARLADKIAPAAVIPVHYGTVVGTKADFDRFAAAVKNTRVVAKL